MSSQAIPQIVVIGGGPAGTFAAMAARTQQPIASVTLLTLENCEPYEKPPLSKGVLVGKIDPMDSPIAGPGGITRHAVRMEPGAECIAIDRAVRTVLLRDGRELRYDALVLAPGSHPREIPYLPAGTPGVRYLRTEADARLLKAALARGGKLLVIGAGLIGLEVAASAIALGVSTTVLEIAPRILSRVCDEHTAAIVHEAHRQHGVDIRVETGVAAASPRPDGRVEIVTTSGEALLADIVVVGTGVRPNDGVAAASGLAVNDGILVDQGCRTSDPVIYAAGDAVRFPGPDGLVRLENWRHAQDQGIVAGRNAAGANEVYVTVPSFWSEQYDLYIQGVGWGRAGDDLVRRPLRGNGALVFDISEGRLIGAMGINAQRDLAAARRLIERGVPVDPAMLADPSQPLPAMLKRQQPA